MKYLTRLALIIILAYGVLYLYFFWQTPLGQTPVLDGSENILLAQKISSGSLPKEPFFRSMLYPAFLSIPCFYGIDGTDELFTLASLFGMIFHFISSILVYLSITHLWNNTKAGIIGALIYGLYPPAVFFAGEPLDITPSICFMLGALYTFLLATEKNKSTLFALSGVLLGIGCLLRSNLLPFGIIYLVYPFSFKTNFTNQPPKDKPPSIKLNCFISIISLSLMMLSGGIACYLHSGEFRLLPWQGASNFYSANSQRANGKFYRHTIYIPNRQMGDNPARLESEYIYSIETGKKPPFNLDDFNKFWLKKSFNEIASNPLKWIKLTLKKIYYLYNNYEQYNNKTFGFHKELTPILKYNPLCFGFLIILLFLFLLKMPQIPSLDYDKIVSIATSIDALCIGIVAFYVSSRFRLPIVPLIIIVSSGLFTFKINEILNIKNVLPTLFASFVTFSTFFNVADTSTWNEDRLLNAFACSRLGLDEEQVLWTERVLETEPNNLQAIRLKLVGFTNLVLSGKITNSKDWILVRKELKYLNDKNIFFEDTALLLGCYVLKFENDKEKAYQILVNGGAESLQPDFYQAILIYSKLLEPTKTDKEIARLTPLLAASIINKGEDIKNYFYSDKELDIAKNALKFLLD